MTQNRSDVLPPENCPDPSVHGNPFRYCPYCSWMEPLSADRPSLPTALDAIREAAWKAVRVPPSEVPAALGALKGALIEYDALLDKTAKALEA